jgi:hypothetical protein
VLGLLVLVAILGLVFLVLGLVLLVLWLISGVVVLGLGLVGRGILLILLVLWLMVLLLGLVVLGLLGVLGLLVSRLLVLVVLRLVSRLVGVFFGLWLVAMLWLAIAVVVVMVRGVEGRQVSQQAPAVCNRKGSNSNSMTQQQWWLHTGIKFGYCRQLTTLSNSFSFASMKNLWLRPSKQTPRPGEAAVLQVGTVLPNSKRSRSYCG